MSPYRVPRLRRPLLAACLAALATAVLSGCVATAPPESPITGSPLEVQGPSLRKPPPIAEPIKATNPHAAMEWRRLSWVDEHGNIPPGALRSALIQRRDSLARSFRESSEAAPANWIEWGPENVGGRSRALLIDPRDPDRLVGGSVSGGIWLSDDRGASWRTVDDFLEFPAIGCLTRDPFDADTIYAGTGEGYFNGDAIGGGGIYKSTDNGDSWALLESTIDFDNITRIAISPTDPHVMLIGKRYGGVLRSDDGGNSWTTTYGAQGAYDVDFHPWDGTQAIAHIIDYDFDLSDWFHQAIYSEDGGATWSAAAGLEAMYDFNSRIELAYAPSDPQIVYASTAIDGGIWKSIDGGRSFSPQTVTGQSATSWYANPLWVDPTNPDVLLTGGFDVYRSDDGGITLTRISAGYLLTEQPHPDIHHFVEDPNYDGNANRRVYVGTDGGFFRTEDIYSANTGSGWEAVDKSYRTTQFYGADGHGPTMRLYGGTQDNGSLRLDNDTSARLTFGGDGGFSAIARDDPDYMYGEYIFLQIHRSTNGGLSASYIYNGLGDAGSDANFIAPFILDPNDPNTLLAGGRSLWRTRDAKAPSVLWEEVRGPGTDRASAIAVAPGNSDIIWLGLNNGEIWQSQNGTLDDPNWQAIDDNDGVNPLPDRYVTRMLVDPLDSNLAYVAFGGFEDDNLYVTRDGGQSWNDLTGTGDTGLPHCPIRGIARHPANPNWLFVGTEVGLFSSRDGGESWSTNDRGPSSVSIDETVFMHDSEILLVATHGRGLFTTDLPTRTLELEVPVLQAGQPSEMVVTGAEPGAEVVFGLSTAGRGQEFVENLAVTIDLREATVLGRVTADENGRAALSKTLPPDAAGQETWIQAAAKRATSEVSEQVVQP